MEQKLLEIANRNAEIMDKLSSPDIIQDFDLYQKLMREQSKLAPTFETYEMYKRLQSDLKQSQELVNKEKDEELLAMAQAEIEEVQSKLKEVEEKLTELLTPRDERDDGNVIMEIRPAAGGDEAGLFAASLLRMYTMYADACGFRVEINDIDESEIGGLKHAGLMIIGDGAFSKFKYESGVHRVQRVPDTETQGRIHTSTATVAVLPETVTVDVKIEEKDLRVDVYRSSGAGGQHVNKTESAVRLTHLPTGIVVACQDNRSQIKNRERAMSILAAKLADHYQAKEDEKYAATRKTQVGTGDRSERIRTYNFPQGRVTDHRIGKSLYNIGAFMNGEIDEMVVALSVAGKQS